MTETTITDRARAAAERQQWPEAPSTSSRLPVLLFVALAFALAVVRPGPLAGPGLSRWVGDKQAMGSPRSARSSLAPTPERKAL